MQASSLITIDHPVAERFNSHSLPTNRTLIIRVNEEVSVKIIVQFSESEYFPKRRSKALLFYWCFLPSTFSSEVSRPEIKIFLRVLQPQKVVQK